MRKRILFMILIIFIPFTIHAWTGSGAWGAVRDFLKRANTNIKPSADDTYDLGSSTREWKDLYIDGTAEIDVLNAGTITATDDITIQKADPSVIFDTITATDTNWWLGGQDDAGSDDDDKFMIGDGTTTGSNIHFTIDTNGNIGIGTTAPSGKLHLPQESSTTIPTLTFGDGDSGITESADDTFRWIIEGGTKYTINASGIQGVASNSFMALEEAASATNPVWSFNLDNDTGIGRAAADILSLIAGGTNGLNVNSNGNVGIGTTGPQALLHAGTGPTQGLFVTQAGNVGIGVSGPSDIFHVVASPSPTIRFKGDSGGTPNLILQNATVWQLRNNGSSADNFEIRDATTDTVPLKIEKGADDNSLYIDTNGNVGIGTASPERKLHIFAGDSSGASSGNALLILENSAIVDLQFMSGNTSNTAILFGDDGSPTAGTIQYAHDDERFEFDVEGARVMIIDTNSLISLSNNDSGTSNTIFGKNAGDAIASGGNQNTLFGEDAGGAITTGDNNAVLGYQALDAATTALQNVAIGVDAMGAVPAATAISDVIAIGYRAANVTDNTAANGSIAIGTDTLKLQTSGSNIGIGFEALSSVIAGAANTAIGYQALKADTGSNNVAVGYLALTANTSANSNVAVGHSAGKALTTGEQNVMVGLQTLDVATTALQNVAIGTDAFGALPSGVAMSGGVAIGFRALDALTAASHGVIAIGNSALGSLTSGIGNIAIGNTAGSGLTTGTQNTILGAEALDTADTALQNTAIGSEAMGGVSTGIAIQDVVAIGYHAADATLTTGAKGAVAIGTDALGVMTSGAKNVAVGFQAGDVITTGGQNVIIGYDADASANTGTNQIVIGSEVTGIADNTAMYGNSSMTQHIFQAGNVGIGTTGPSQELHVKGDGTFEDDTPNILSWDSDVNEGYMWHTEFNTGGAPWNNFALWRMSGTVGSPTVNPNTPLLYFDDNNVAHFPTGGIGRNRKTIVSNYTATVKDEFIHVDASASNLTVTLPAVASFHNALHIKKIDSTANTVTIDGNSSETLDDETTQVLIAQYQSLSIVPNEENTEWWIH